MFLNVQSRTINRNPLEDMYNIKFFITGFIPWKVSWHWTQTLKKLVQLNQWNVSLRRHWPTQALSEQLEKSGKDLLHQESG